MRVLKGFGETWETLFKEWGDTESFQKEVLSQGVVKGFWKGAREGSVVVQGKSWLSWLSGVTDRQSPKHSQTS